MKDALKPKSNFMKLFGNPENKWQSNLSASLLSGPSGLYMSRRVGLASGVLFAGTRPLCGHTAAFHSSVSPCRELQSWCHWEVVRTDTPIQPVALGWRSTRTASWPRQLAASQHTPTVQSRHAILHSLLSFCHLHVGTLPTPTLRGVSTAPYPRFAMQPVPCLSALLLGFDGLFCGVSR